MGKFIGDLAEEYAPKAGGAAGAAAGGALGSMVAPGFGTAIGSSLGGAIGSKLAAAAVHRIRHRNDKAAQHVAAVENKESMAHAEDAAAVRKALNVA